VKILFQLNQTMQQRQLEKLRWIFPIKLAMYATALRNQGNTVVWDGHDDGSFDKIITSEIQIDIPFLKLPHADRILTDAFNPKWQRNGNFKYRPACYIQSASSCWWGKCSFCRENGKSNEIREVDDVVSEIQECKELGAKECFDDSGTFPTGRWLDEFIDRYASIHIPFGCNLRIFNYPFRRMARSGFRMALFGIESANQETLDRIQKGVRVEDIIPTLKKASDAGLENHLAFMVGYPWESYREAENTIRFAHYLLRKGLAKTAQCSFYTPPQGTGNEAHRKYVNKIYDVWQYPDFWYHQIISIKNMADLKYLIRSIKEGIKSAANSNRGLPDNT
jgi:anaerobic magnesium-protoporphyrin IX monomethyl ester cyclase